MALLSAAAADFVIAVLIAPAGAATGTVTLGSTLGTPHQNICATGIDCTYVPFSQNLSSPYLQVPFDGTVTSFSVNSGSAAGSVELRVLRPAGSGQYTGAGTSPVEALAAAGVNTFTVALPVKAGDVLGLDNSSSAILFDDSASSTTYIAAYYQPALADGATGAPNGAERDGYRLLLSATVAATPVTTATTTTASTTTTGGTTTTTPPAPPTLTHVAQSHRAWREGPGLPRFDSGSGASVGTTFSFTLDEPARVRFAFSRLLPGRMVNRRCVAPSQRTRHRRACRRSVLSGTLSLAAGAGRHRLVFQGRLSRTRRLPTGSYDLVITASTASGLRSAPAMLRFAIRGTR